MALPELPFLALLWVGVALLFLLGGRNMRGICGHALPTAFFLAFLGAYFSSRQVHSFVLYTPGVAGVAGVTGVTAATSIRLALVRHHPEGVFVEDPAGVIRTGGGEYYRGHKFIPNRFMSSHFHRSDTRTIVCRQAHAPPQLRLMSEQTYPNYARHFFWHWWPGLTLVIALVSFVIRYPLAWLFRESLLLLVPHPVGSKIPPVWQSQGLKQRLERMTAAVRAKSAFITKLTELARSRRKAESHEGGDHAKENTR